jgi:hypothetical protein
LEAREHAAVDTREPYYQVLCNSLDVNGDLSGRLELATKSFVHCQHVSQPVTADLLDHEIDYCSHEDIMRFDPASGTSFAFTNRFKEILFPDRIDLSKWAVRSPPSPPPPLYLCCHRVCPHGCVWDTYSAAQHLFGVCGVRCASARAPCDAMHLWQCTQGCACRALTLVHRVLPRGACSCQHPTNSTVEIARTK